MRINTPTLHHNWASQQGINPATYNYPHLPITLPTFPLNTRPGYQPLKLTIPQRLPRFNPSFRTSLNPRTYQRLRLHHIRLRRFRQPSSEPIKNWCFGGCTTHFYQSWNQHSQNTKPTDYRSYHPSDPEERRRRCQGLMKTATKSDS